MSGDPVSMLALGGGGEFDAIRRMAGRWGPRARGLGDDAAVVAVPRGDRLVASVDSAIEGRHFRREWLGARDIGRRAVYAALSDLAAMAARPLGIMVALAIPPSWRDSIDDLADGIGDALTTADTLILGGNISGASELSITTTVLGHAFEPLSRAGARIGDAIYVTGSIGGVGAAVDALVRGELPAQIHARRFVSPVPRLREARWLANRGASAAIDISDGLVADLGHLAAASDVRIEVELELLPCDLGVAPRSAASSGEEYELIVSAPAGLDAAEFESRFGIALTAIGKVVTGSRDAVLTEAGECVSMPPGYDHFAA